MPPSVTATSGVDALTHAIESYVSRDANLASELFSLRAVGLIAAGLPAAYRDGDDLDARETVQLGATMAMIGGMNAHMGLCHAMAMPLCGLYPIPHGLACGLTLPHVLEFNAEAVPDRVADILGALGIDATGIAAAGGDPAGDLSAPYRATAALLDQRRRRRPPRRLRLHRGTPGADRARDAQQRPVPVQPAGRVGRRPGRPRAPLVWSPGPHGSHSRGAAHVASTAPGRQDLPVFDPHVATVTHAQVGDGGRRERLDREDRVRPDDAGRPQSRLEGFEFGPHLLCGRRPTPRRRSEPPTRRRRPRRGRTRSPRRGRPDERAPSAPTSRRNPRPAGRDCPSSAWWRRRPPAGRDP